MLLSRRVLFAGYCYSLLLCCLLISGTGFLQANSGLRSFHFKHNHNQKHVSASSELASLRNTPQSLSQASTVSGAKFVGRSIRSLLLLGGSIPLSVALSKAKSAIAATTTSNGIKKRLSDKREYKAMELENGLRVLLISDPTASRAAAAVDVHVGSFSDPAEVPGLAHFCEHMSFLGTKKYPNEDEFSTFLSEHGGSSNAYTDSEDTVYYFDVNAEHLDGALDRFAQFFINPLFTESATNRELNAIESKHSKNINSDGFRLYQLERDTANPLHPLNKFGTGNKDTLEIQPKANGIDVRRSLLEFHRRYYSSNLMTLAVEGKESIQALERQVRSKFSTVPNRKVSNPALQWWGKVEPYLEASETVVFEVVPIGESRSIKVSWPIWIKDQQQKLQIQNYKPEFYLSHLLGHEGIGSLRSFLTRKGWCNALQSYIGNEVSDLQMFEVSVDLTPEGFENRYEVVDAIFAYVGLLKEKINDGLPDYIIDELRQLSSINFEFAEKSDPADYVSDIVANMQHISSPTDYLTGSRLITQFDPALTASYLTHFTAANTRIEVVAADFANKTTEKGKYYGTDFNVFKSAELTNRWSNIRPEYYQELFLPNPNPFIPRNFKVFANPSQASTTEEERLQKLRIPPQRVASPDNWEVWYKLDDCFEQPKVYAVFQMAVAKEFYTPQFVVNSKIFSLCLTESLTEFLYEARLGGLDFSLDFTSKGVQVTISGFNDKFSEFFDQIMKLMMNYRPEVTLFNRVKDVLKRDLDSWNIQQPYSHAAYYAGLALESMQFEIDELKQALSTCKAVDVGNFLKQALSKSKGTAMFVGNILETDVQSTMNNLNDYLSFASLPEEERAHREVAILPVKPTGGLLLKHPEPNQNDVNSAVIFYFQIPNRDPTKYMYADLLAEIIEQVFYDSLRTKQQLGYIVYSGISVKQEVRFLVMTVQSSSVSGRELVRRIEHFVDTELISILQELSKDQFSDFKDAVIHKLMEPDQRLTQQAGRFWSEIMNSNSHYNRLKEPLFDRSVLEANAIEDIQWSNFMIFVQDYILPGGKNRRLLVSEIDGNKVHAEERERGDSSETYSTTLELISKEIEFNEHSSKM